jgi:hypothetical protein
MKRAKLQIEKENQNSNFNNIIPLTSQQLDIEEKRIQHQLQDLMYQKYVLEKQRLLLEGHEPVPDRGDEIIPPP